MVQGQRMSLLCRRLLVVRPAGAPAASRACCRCGRSQPRDRSPDQGSSCWHGSLSGLSPQLAACGCLCSVLVQGYLYRAVKQQCARHVWCLVCSWTGKHATTGVYTSTAHALVVEHFGKTLFRNARSVGLGAATDRWHGRHCLHIYPCRDGRSVMQHSLL